MASMISLGNELSEAGILHRLDVRVKIVVMIVFGAAIFMVSEWLGLAICGTLIAIAYGVSCIPARLAVKAVKPLLYLMVFTVLISALTFTAGLEQADQEAYIITLFGSFGLSLEGALKGLFIALKIAFVLAMASLLTYTTSLIALVDALSSLMKPLKCMKVPVEDVAMVCALTLRFVPLLVEEANRITSAQKSRGLIMDEGSLMKRAQAWIPILVPLFVSMFKRADKLACAMDTRCYHNRNRTHLHVLEGTMKDVMFGSSISVLLVFTAIVL